jgi:hypothetical protein
MGSKLPLFKLKAMFKLRIQQMFQLKSGQLLTLFLISAGVLLLIRLTDEETWWNNWLDPAIGFGTFLFAAAVWYSEWRQDWEHRLPKRLTVRFMYEGQLVMICKQAHLTGEADIRTWGQQIGSQMGNRSKLHFLPFFETATGKPQKDEQNLIYKPYYLCIYLSDLPANLKDEFEKDKKQKIYLRWMQGKDGQQLTSWETHPEVLPPLEQNEDL